MIYFLYVHHTEGCVTQVRRARNGYVHPREGSRTQTPPEGTVFN